MTWMELEGTRLREISQRKTDQYALLYVESKIAKLIETEWNGGHQGMKVGEKEEIFVKGFKISVRR